MGNLPHENMRRLIKPITDSTEYKKLLATYQGDKIPTRVFGMPENSKAALLTALLEDTGATALVVCPNDYAAQKLYNALFSSLGDKVLLMPSRTVHLSRSGVQSRQTQGLRAKALETLISGGNIAVVAGIDAVRARLAPPKDFAANCKSLKAGTNLPIEKLSKALTNAGYERVDIVRTEGQFAVRGGIVDIFASGGEAYRLDLFGDEIESVYILDTLSQRSVRKMEECSIPPAFEAPLLKDTAFKLLQAMEKTAKSAQSEPAKRLKANIENISLYDFGYSYEALSLLQETFTALDYLSETGILIFDEPARLEEHALTTDAEIAYSAAELAARGMAPLGWEKHLAPYSSIRIFKKVFRLEFSVIEKTNSVLDFQLNPIQPYHGRIDLLAQDLKFRKKAGWKSCIVLSNFKKCQSLFNSLLDRQLECTVVESLIRDINSGEIIITTGSLGVGFEMPANKYLVITEAEAFLGIKTQPQRHKQKAAAALELKEGDYAVHDVHGIGIYRGLVTVEVEGRPKDFMLLEYKNQDKLYIPAEQLDRVHKYIGSDDATPKLSKMGGAEWAKAKQKAYKGVKKLAQDLVALYSSRQALKGFAFSADSPWQKEFEQAFEFEETEGQEQCLEEIKRDMESPKIMDRLLCGDVGYGKTEVAMRAAFKCVMDAKQVMVLVPTTVLAYQHYNTMKERFEGYPIKMDMISRFKTQAEQNKTIEQFKNGEIDILIGTHRLLSKDLRPHDLGLLIIDEEHRFGVGHKEAIKDLRRTVDVLTMTATPIPRTLEMSLSGIRDMSVIHTPPSSRLPVNTYLVEYSPVLIREAILRELSRAGQVYVVYNSVRDMERFVTELRSLVPEARIIMAHGQMPENELEKAMLAFYSQEADVLVCSTIIESGLDIPNANTMVIIDADKLGLAQLYQLRGRIGRSNRLAHCYVTYRENKLLSENATKRLEAISEFTELGSGFQIALRDLEIRGAGNLLGPEQHGHMANVGYETYWRLLSDAVAEAKGEAPVKTLETSVDVPIKAYIPDKFIASKEQKIQIYRKIAGIEQQSDADDIITELCDRFGKVPEEVINLVDISLLRAAANRAGISFVNISEGLARIRFDQSFAPAPNLIINACNSFKGIASINTAGITLKVKKAYVRHMLTETINFIYSIKQ